MIVVDSHCHVSPTWFEPVEVLLYHMEQNDVAGAVLVQDSDKTNNDYQFECMRRYPGRFASVVVIDTDRPDAERTLERLVERGAGGLRMAAATRSPGADPYAIWRASQRLGIAVSCWGRSAEFASPQFASLVQAMPDLPIVIEHLGSYNRPDLDPLEARQPVFALARFPNLYIKIPGLGELCQRVVPVDEAFPFEQPIPPFLPMAYDAFGPDRMMWGSDFPPVSAREGFGNALRFPLEQFASANEVDRGLIFGGVTRRLFPARG